MASIDIDEYLKQEDSSFAHDSSNEMDMSEFKQNIFETNGFGVFGSYGNNLSMDPFSDNSGNGGHGSLSFYGNMTHQLPVAPSGLNSHSFSDTLGHAVQNHGSALSGLNGHFPSQNLQQDFGEHQPANSSNHAEQYESSSVMPNDEVDEIVDSVEHGQDSREQEGEEDKVPLKHEDDGSDDEFKDEDEEDEAAEDDEEDDDGQKKRKLKDKRKPYKQPRILTRWDRKSDHLAVTRDDANTFLASKDQLTLLSLIYILERENIKVPYEELNLLVNGGAKWDDAEGGSVFQHLNKLRKARIFFGLPVPPPRKGKRGTMDDPKIPSEKEIKTYRSLTHIRSDHEDKMSGIPGTMKARYAPIPIPGRPDLPIYDPTQDPPMWPLPDGFEFQEYNKDVNTPGASKATPASDKRQVKALKISVKKEEEEEFVPLTSTEKKGRSTKKTVKTQEDNVVQPSEKSARKGKNTPAVSKRKAAAKADSTSTPAKPKGVPKSKKAPATQKKKTPATLNKIAVSLDEKLDLDATPSKQTRGEKKGLVDAAPEFTEMLTTEPGSVTINEEEQSGQSYGRIDTNAISMPTQSFRNMHAGLPPNMFRMGGHQPNLSFDSQSGHQPNQSFDSQTSMSTAPSQSMHNAPTQFIPNGFNHSQNDFASTGFGHQLMPAHGPSFAHGHDWDGMNKQELIAKLKDMTQQQAASQPMQHYNSSHNYGSFQTPGNVHAHGNIHAHGHGPRGLGITNTSTMMPSGLDQLDMDMSNYTFTSGPASDLPAQQNLFTNPYDAQMPNDGNDKKPNMEPFSFSEDFNISDMDASNIFHDNQ